MLPNTCPFFFLCVDAQKNSIFGFAEYCKKTTCDIRRGKDMLRDLKVPGILIRVRVLNKLSPDIPGLNFNSYAVDLEVKKIL